MYYGKLMYHGKHYLIGFLRFRIIFVTFSREIKAFTFLLSDLLENPESPDPRFQ